LNAPRQAEAIALSRCGALVSYLFYRYDETPRPAWRTVAGATGARRHSRPVLKKMFQVVGKGCFCPSAGLDEESIRLGLTPHYTGMAPGLSFPS